MRILIAHNAYQLRGGEDMVVDAEIELLRSHGDEVAVYRRDNSEVNGMSKPALALNTLWSKRTIHDLEKLIAEFRPDVIHAHNTLPLISPSLYWAAERAGVPVVHTLHNFRLMCLNAMFLREGKVCEDCLGRLPWRGVVRKCYRGSAVQSAMLAGMVVLHRGLGTYQKKVARFIALNNFPRDKFVQGGLAADRIEVKPNFVDFPAPENKSRQGMLFVGRLSAEKGIKTLAQAAALMVNPELRVAGDGPEANELEGKAGITRLGSLNGNAVRNEMNNAVALVLPSICYENFPRTIVEAFACGLPVIASRLGAMAELVRDGETGLLFEPGNAQDLAGKLEWAQLHPDAMMEMGCKARAQYETEFSAEVNYQLLTNIYKSVVSKKRSTSIMDGQNRVVGHVLGVPIDVIDWNTAVTRVVQWGKSRESRYVCCCNVHSVVTARQDEKFGQVVAQADMATADGAPVAWFLRKLGFKGQQRINGPDLMWRCCAEAEITGVSVYLFGSTPETLKLLDAKLKKNFPRLVIAGIHSPAFGTVSEEVKRAEIEHINASGAGLVFVGLGCPKQEWWIAKNRGVVSGVMMGVGAAFDYHAGTLKRAPLWMQNSGLEWLHRLASEPRRLWKRYLVTNSIFVVTAVRQLYFKGQ